VAGVRGYLKTATGRPLAAYDTDELGRVRCYIDEAVYREQFAQLIPRAVDASRSLIDWLWPSWPELTYDAVAGHVDLAVDAALQAPEVLVFTQDPAGVRTIRQRYSVRPGQRSRIAGLAKPTAELRTILVLRARRPTGEPLLIEHVLGAESKVYSVITGPDYAPPPPPPPAPELPPEPSEPEPAEAPPAELPPPAAVEPAAEPAPKASPIAKPTRKRADATPTEPAPKASPDAKPKPDAKPAEPAPKASPDATPAP
jgi:hypothetical protein